MSNSKFARKGCRECYACVRVCPADAIVIKDGQADILADRCIFWGRSSKAWPQNKQLEKLSKITVKEFIKSGENVIASVAPSFASAFGNQSL